MVEELDSDKVYYVDNCISSGMYGDISFFSKHPFRSKMFIDWVDTEWCWRIRKLGYKIPLCPNAKFSHKLGEHTSHLFGIKFVTRSKFRYKMIVRNALYLVLMGYINKKELYVAILKNIFMYLGGMFRGRP